MELTFIDFFAGVGGMRRGLELCGHRCVGFCEIDKYAVMSYTSMHLITEEQRQYLATLDLKQRQKEILKEEYRNGEWYANDICKLHAGDIPKADIWCFGSPCQSFSQAGSRTGLDGVSGLIGEIFRLLSETREKDRPRYLISENVKGMLTSRKGFDFLRILMEMDRGGTMSNGNYSTLKISFPKTEKGYSLSDILEEQVPQKYFLSKQQVERIVWKSDKSEDSKANGTTPTNTECMSQTGLLQPLQICKGGAENLTSSLTQSTEELRGYGNYSRKLPRNTEGDRDSCTVTSERLQRCRESVNDTGDAFLIDKGFRPQERTIANCLTSKGRQGTVRAESVRHISVQKG